MILASMQPYFFPFLGYFQLMKYADYWVVFDTAQYIRHGWVNRNRILSPNLQKNWQYISIPIKNHSQKTKINEIKIKNIETLDNLIFGKLSYYKQIKAPFYHQTIDLLSTIQFKSSCLSKINLSTMVLFADYLNIPFNYSVLSEEKNFPVKSIKEPGDWALNISKYFGASTYVNPINGRKILDKKCFRNENIKLQFIKPKDITYNQKKHRFEPSLSIIDTMMFNSKEKVIEMINQFTILE